MTTVEIATRQAAAADADALAAAHAEAWRGTYRGIIPAVALERMIARRGLTYWRELLERAPSAILVLVFNGELAGYATIGRMRSGPSGRIGEIYELYLRPQYQGVGLGKRLFEAARRRLQDAGCRSLTVWALTDNEAACAFYRRMGGRGAGERRERIGGVSLRKTCFVWQQQR